MSSLSLPPQRLAVESDGARISELMRMSVRELFPAFYDQQQTASAAVHIAHLDMQLIDDGTYFVHEAADEIVACGGWSRRNKLYSGPGAAEDDDRLLDPDSEPARVRAMFVRSDWTRRGIAGRYSSPVSGLLGMRASGTSYWARRSPASPSTARSGFVRWSVLS
jgi:hypothetical protein